MDSGSTVTEGRDMYLSKQIKRTFIAGALSLVMLPIFCAVPAHALPATQVDEPLELQRVKMFQEVENTYKAFSTSSFYVPKYDVTYKKLYFKTSFSLRGVKPINYYSGTYSGWNGQITVFKCEYNVW